MLTRLTAQQVSDIRKDLQSWGVEGSALLAIPAYSKDADSHVYIRDIVLAFLRALFRSMSDHPELRWDAEETVSKIKIGYADPRNDGVKGFVPAVTVELGPFTWGNQSINNLLFEEANGTQTFTDLRNGSVVIRCRCGTKLEADSLASVIHGAFHYMHADLERISGITWIEANNTNPSSGELNQTNNQGEFFVANVVLNVHYQETWKRMPTRKVVGTVVFNENPRGVYLD